MPRHKESKTHRLPQLTDIIGSRQIRRRSITLDRINWPVGTVLLWYGAAADVPDGWQICDGTNGTPNMSTKYPRGQTSGSVGGTGGANTHTLSEAEMPAHVHTGPSHRHTISASGDHNHLVSLAVSAGADWCATTASGYTKGYTSPGGDHAHGGNTGYAGTGNTGSKGSGSAHNNEPAYVTFYYIMFVGD